MPAVAVPTLRVDLGLTTGTAAWVMSGYVLGYAGFTLLGGRAADLLGRRRMFLTWLSVFLVFSTPGGFATDGRTLVVARFVTGVAAAFMTPAAMSIITTSYPEGPRRDKALLVFAGVGAGGFSLGLVIGGLLTELGRRWVFFAPVFLAGALLLAALGLLPPEARPEPARHGYDLPGAACAAAAMPALPTGRGGLVVRGDVPEPDHRGHRLRPRVRAAHHRGDRQRGRGGTGPGWRAVVHVHQFGSAVDVPVVMVVLGAAVSALGLEGPRGRTTATTEKERCT